jgi:transposase
MRDAVNNGRMPNMHPTAIRKEVVAAIEKGVSVAAEARRVNVPVRTIYDWLWGAGVRRPRPSDLKAEILAKVHEGISVRAVAEDSPVAERTIYKWLAESKKQS